MATTPVQNLPVLGNLLDGDTLVGEKVPGTTGLITINGILYDEDFNDSQGIMTTTAPGVYANRTITGTSNRISIVNGAGTAGNPTIDISNGYEGQVTITTLGTVTTGTWQGSIVAMQYGGTSKNLTPSNGGIVYTDADSMEVLSGTTESKMLLSGANAAPSWSTSKIPTSSGDAGRIIISDGTDYVLSTAKLPTSVGANNTRLKSNGTDWVVSSTTMPDTGTNKKIIIGNGTNYIESNASYPNTTTINQLLYSSANNDIAGLATANNGVLITSAGGVPSIATDIPTAVTIGGQYSYRVGGNDVSLADGGTGTSLTAPAADRIMFYDVSATSTAYLTPGTGLTITGTTINGPVSGPATQAEQEAASITTAYVSPGRQQYHPSAAKAWAKFGVSGDLISSFNVTSVTDVGVGAARVNFTVPFSAANAYGAFVSLQGTGAFAPAGFIAAAGMTTGSVDVLSINVLTANTADPAVWHVVCFGDQ